MTEQKWEEIGEVTSLLKDFEEKNLKQILVSGKKLALSYRNGKFGVISGVCNHAGGPLGKGHVDSNGYVVCPWHYWKFHHETGAGEPGYEDDCVPAYSTKIAEGKLFVDLASETKRNKKKHPDHPLARDVKRAEGPIRILGISTTAMDPNHPRYSTSEALLEKSLAEAALQLKVETRMLRLSNLKFRNCEGFYSKSAHACTWPCSITQMDPQDEMEQVYEGLVHWADVVIVATPIRWGSASSLYFKMAERLNCVQNQITLKENILINKKVASFIITGGQDNVQAVAGEMLTFFSELGFMFPPFPFVAHSLGWTAENMERNVKYVSESSDLHTGSFELIKRSVDLAKAVLGGAMSKEKSSTIGRKAHPMQNEIKKLAYETE